MQDVAHTFRRGHRMMVQIQSSWFPMVDRYPQRFVPAAEATADDYQTATHRVFVSPERPSPRGVRVRD